MNNDANVSTPEARFGAFLKREREMRRVELTYVANFSRIPLERLQDLEAGRWDVFGAFIYLRGAVFNYARAVGLDVDDLLLRLESEVPIKGRSATTPLAVSTSPLFRKSPEDIRPKRLMPFGVLSLMVLFVAGMLWLTQRRLIEQHWANPSLNKAPDNVQDPMNVAVAVSFETESTAPVSAANQTSEASVLALTPVPLTKPVRQAVKPLNVLEVRALDTAWLEYSSDDGATRNAILHAGDKIRIRAHQLIKIRSGNAGGVELYLNGVKQPPLGDVGAVRERRFDLQSP